MVLQELADEGFAAAVGVDVGGVDEIAAGFAVGVVNLEGAPALVLAEGYGAQVGFGNSEAAVAENSVSHG